MRVGRSDNHDKKIIQSVSFHRVIIPIYIPNEQDYYKDAFKIFKLCLLSLKKASAPNTPVTVVANGCPTEIHSKMLELQNEGLIEELFLETAQLGKINSLRKAIAASDEPYLTISDGDVMFLPEWDVAVHTVFNKIPKATAVSPIPVFKTFNQYCSNIWFDNLWNGKVRFERPANPEALEKFANSIGWSYLREPQKETILTLTQGSFKAIVGCSHFCTTYKRDALLFAPQVPSQFLLSGNSEGLYLDTPTILNDGYRLSTFTNHGYHLGNTWEPWMDEELTAMKGFEPMEISWSIGKKLAQKPINHWLKFKVFKKLLTKKSVYNYAIRRFNVPSDYMAHYLK